MKKLEVLKVGDLIQISREEPTVTYLVTKVVSPNVADLVLLIDIPGSEVSVGELFPNWQIKDLSCWNEL